MIFVRMLQWLLVVILYSARCWGCSLKLFERFDSMLWPHLKALIWGAVHVFCIILSGVSNMSTSFILLYCICFSQVYLISWQRVGVYQWHWALFINALLFLSLKCNPIQQEHKVQHVKQPWSWIIASLAHSYQQLNMIRFIKSYCRAVVFDCIRL